jgi:myo-inositol-1(or 4)-monophosphatase
VSAAPDAAEALAIARQVAAEAAALLGGAAGAVGTVRSKSNLRDLVTEWDTRCEELVRTRLGALAPGIPILGEEGGLSGASDKASHSGSGSGDLWLVDPIDGTVNFAHGMPIWAVCISLERDGVPIAGVVRAPALGWEFAASSGGGATHNGERIAVSAVASLDAAMLASGFPYDRATSPQNNFAQWEHFQRNAGACRRLGAASLDLCMVARGWYDGYWERRLSPWDVSAGALMVIEAGGVITDTRGSTFASSKGEAVASNGAIHQSILRELAAADRLPGR